MQTNLNLGNDEHDLTGVEMYAFDFERPACAALLCPFWYQSRHMNASPTNRWSVLDQFVHNLTARSFPPLPTFSPSDWS